MVRLLDLSGLFWRTWMASAGKPASFTYERVMGRVVEFDHACSIAICLDSDSSWRKDFDPQYKANRPAREAAAIEQLRRCIAELRAKGYPVWEAEGMEADDVIASACLSPTLAEHEIQIATTDKDLLALVDERVLWLSLATNELRGPKEVMSAFGVAPTQIRDLLALWGDSSDNVPGARGVGAKHAARLLMEFGDLAGILAAVQEPGKVTPASIEKAIQSCLGDIDRSARLVTLRTDLELPFEEVLEPRAATASSASETQGFSDPGFGESEEPARAPAAAPAPPPPPPKIAARVVEVESARAAVGPRVVASSTALAVAATTSPSYMLALEPGSLHDAFKLARSLFDSGLFSGRGGHVNVESIFAVILKGRTMGIDAMTALSGIDIIKGKPRVSAGMLVGLILRSGLAKYFSLVETTEKFAIYETWRVGAPRPAPPMKYTIEEAERSGKLRPSRSGELGSWHTDPKTMLRHRASSALARAVYQDVAANVYVVGELEDDEPEIPNAEYEEAS